VGIFMKEPEEDEISEDCRGEAEYWVSDDDANE
jgi:hypothetical protein